MSSIQQAGNYVKDEVWHSLIVVITNASNLHGYAVRLLYRAVQAAGEQVLQQLPRSPISFFSLLFLIVSYKLMIFSCQETLVRVAVWCIGEYGDILVNNAGRLDIEEPLTVSSCFRTITLLSTNFDLCISITFLSLIILHHIPWAASL